MLVVRPNNLSGNINALVKSGLIRRELNVSDQRSLLAVLTPEGETFLTTNLPAHWRRVERLMNGLSREQRVQLVALLKQMVLSIQAEQKPSKKNDRSEKMARNAWQESVHEGRI